MRIVSLSILLTMAVMPIRATATTIEDEIERTTVEILRKEIDLERTYLKWRLFASKDPKWRRGRYFALQEGGTACAMAASFFSVAEQGKHLQSPEKIRARPLKTGYTAGLVGCILGGGGSVIELGSNLNTTLKNIRQSKSPECQRRDVVARVKAIDARLKEHAMLTAQLPADSEQARAANAEARVLKLFRDWCLFEFSDVYADARSYQASNNVYYVMDIAGQSTAAVTYGMSTASLKRPTISGSISTIGIVSDCFFILSSPISSVAYNVLYKHWHKKLAKQFNEDLPDPENAAKDAMTLFAGSATTDGSKRRLEIYRTWSERYDDYIQESEERLRHLSKVAQQNNISGPLLSANYLAGDILGSAAYYRYRDKPRTSNAMTFAGGVASGAASAAFTALSAQWLIKEKLFERKLKKENKMPEQLIAQRLKTLDDLEGMLNGR